MNYKDLKKGSYFRWRAERMYKAWDTYGKVIKKSKGKVTLITFDDFEETTLSSGGEAIKDEMSLCSKEVIMEYIEDRVINLTTKKAKMELEFKRDIREVDTNITKLNKICV